jgi:hypothetical protein
VISGLPSAAAKPASKAAFHWLVLLAEAHHDDVRALDQRACADRVHAGADVVAPERPLLGPQDRHAARVGGGVVGDRRAERDVEARVGGAALDALAPVGVDLA